MESQRLDALPDVLTVPEAAAVLRLGRNTVYDLIRQGRLPAVRLGRRLLVPRQGIARLLAGPEPAVPPAL